MRVSVGRDFQQDLQGRKEKKTPLLHAGYVNRLQTKGGRAVYFVNRVYQRILHSSRQKNRIVTHRSQLLPEQKKWSDPLHHICISSGIFSNFMTNNSVNSPKWWCRGSGRGKVYVQPSVKQKNYCDRNLTRLHMCCMFPSGHTLALRADIQSLRLMTRAKRANGSEQRERMTVMLTKPVPSLVRATRIAFGSPVPCAQSHSTISSAGSLPSPAA